PPPPPIRRARRNSQAGGSPALSARGAGRSAVAPRCERPLRLAPPLQTTPAALARQARRRFAGVSSCDVRQRVTRVGEHRVVDLRIAEAPAQKRLVGAHVE